MPDRKVISGQSQSPGETAIQLRPVRDDLDEEDLAALERQFPGLTARVRAMRATAELLAEGADHGVQQLHPNSGPVDNSAGRVQPLHPNRPWNHPQNRPPPAMAREALALPRRMTSQGRAAA